MDFIINDHELETLSGLPHIQQLAYLRGIRPYMDVQTGIVGIKRGISYQSISEQLYIEPHQGIKSGSFSRAQIRRALAGLERAGLISFQSQEFQLILKCNLATLGYFVQNKAVTNPSQKAITSNSQKSLENKGCYEDLSQKADIGKTPKADTPLNNNYLFIFLLQQFEKFWDLYPEKKSREKAWQVFQSINPNEMLCHEIISALQNQITITQHQKSQGQWVASWKHPANWLSQRCWEDVLEINTTEGPTHENRSPSYSKQSTRDPFWDACKAGLLSETESNVLTFANYRKKSQAY